MYQHVEPNDDIGFGEFGDADVVADTKATAIRSAGRLAGLLSRAILMRRARRPDDFEGFGEVAPAPCPDALPNQAPGETPCTKKAAALRARAAAWQAARQAGR